MRGGTCCSWWRRSRNLSARNSLRSGDEYEAAATPEARFAKGLDKLETILQHTLGVNPPDFDYRFNLDYGRRHTAGHTVLETVRVMLDEATEARVYANDETLVLPDEA